MSRRKKQSKHARQRQRFRWQLPAAIIAVGIAVVAVILVATSGGGSGEQLPWQRAERSLGKQDAPVSVFVWTDFRCGHCRTANEEVISRLEETYIADSQVQLHFRHFPFLGESSMAAAEASECAAAQGMFWQYHDLLFELQDSDNYGASSLRSTAHAAGLDTSVFDSCLSERSYRQAVEDEKLEGDQRGVESTPTYIIEGKVIRGNQDYEVISAAIEESLP